MYEQITILEFLQQKEAGCHGSMNILVACEESQAVTIELRRLGHNAFSCDIQECSGGHPEWHICGDVLPLLNGNCEFVSMDGQAHTITGKWDMLIAFPPCTYLTVAGNRWFNIEKYGQTAIQRHKDRADAILFFMAFANADCPRIAIENPVGIMSTEYRKPDQKIQPWQFGHPMTKTTCLWLKNLPLLIPTDVLEKPENGWQNQLFTNGRYSGFDTRDENGKVLSWNDPETAKIRSKTFPGIAKAIATQWAGPANNYA